MRTSAEAQEPPQGSADAGLPARHLVYLTLEAPREGQASYAHVNEIVAGFRRRGWSVDLYQPSYTKKKVSPALPLRLIHSLWLQLKLWLSWKRGAIFYVRAHYLAFPSALIARIFGIPVFQEINGPYADLFVTYPCLKPVRPALICLQRWQYRKATALISVTPDLCAWAEQESRNVPCTLISNGADIDKFRPEAKRPGDAPEKYAVFFGGLARWHGVPVMIAAASHPAWPSDVHLVIIGEGQCGEMVREAAARNDKIHALGRLPYEQVPGYVAHAITGLVPTVNPGNLSETGLLPLKLYETLASGIPVIVADFPGQADLVREGGCGLVIPSDDPGALASAVAEIASDPVCARTMGERGRDLIVRHHSWDSRAGQTEDLILTTINPRTARHAS